MHVYVHFSLIFILRLLLRNGSTQSLNVVGLEMEIRKLFLLEFAYTPKPIDENYSYRSIEVFRTMLSEWLCFQCNFRKSL